MLQQMLKDNSGVLRTADAVAAGLSKDSFYRFVEKVGLEKVSHGLFVSPDSWVDEFYLLQARFPKAVFSHETALYLHDLAEREPIPLTVTVPSNYNSKNLIEKGVEINYIKKEWYGKGFCSLTSPTGHKLVVYDMERTICDIVRKRSKIEISAFNYALREFMKRKDKNLPKLMRYAASMRIEKHVLEALGVLL